MKVVFLPALAGLLLTSAAVVPSYAQEAMDSPAEEGLVAGSPAGGERIVINPLVAPEIDWLGGEAMPLTLREVVLATLQSNLDIQIVEKDRDVAGEQVWGEYGIYDPTVNLSVTRSRTDRQTNQFIGNDEDDGRIEVYQDNTTTEGSISQRTPLGTQIEIYAQDSRTDDMNAVSQFGGGVVDPSYGSEAGVRVTQPLLKNAWPLVNNAEIRIAKRRLDQSNFDFEREIQDRLAEVMRAYWNLDFAIRNLAVERQALTSAMELERVNAARVRVGSAPRLSLLQAQAQVAFRESRIAAAEAQVVDAQDTLLSLMNWDPERRLEAWNRPVLPTDSPADFTDVVLDDQAVLNAALQNRPDYQAALVQEDIEGINRDVTKWQRLPELNLFGSIDASGIEQQRGDSWETSRDGDYTSYSFGAEFRYPLFNRQARAAYRTALDRLEQQQLRIESLELLITRQVRSATRGIRTSLEQVSATTRQVVSDTELVDTEQARLQVGETTTFQVLDFQDDLAESRANQARALADYQIALVELGRSTGILLDVLGVDVADAEPIGGWDVFGSSQETPRAARDGEVSDWQEMLRSVPRGSGAALAE